MSMTPMTCEGLPAESYGFYVLGSLSGPELAELQSHLDAGCPRCRGELASAVSIWHGVALSVPERAPSGALRRRVANSVRENPHPFLWVWWQPAAALATLALAVFGGWQAARRMVVPARHEVAEPVARVIPAPADHDLLASLERENQLLKDKLAISSVAPSRSAAPVAAEPNTQNKTEDSIKLLRQQQALLSAAQAELSRQKELLAVSERNAAEAEKKYATALANGTNSSPSGEQRLLAAAQFRTQQLEGDLEQYKALLAVARQKMETQPVQSTILADPNLRVVRLRGTSSGSTIEGHVLLSSGSQVLFYGSQLPALPAGRAYQLWLIRGTAPAIVSAGVFQPNSQRRASVRFESASLTSGITAFAITDEPEAGSLSPTGHKLLIGS